MKLLFLDIDGNLNYLGCKARSPSGCLGIEEEKVKLLREIIDKTGALVILTSTWKTEWFKTAFIEDLSKDGQYLERQLSKYKVFILDKTTDPSWAQRGQGILDFIDEWNGSRDNKVESFVILDDESFDFREVGLMNYFVKTNFTEGLLPEHVEKAVNILNEQRT